jgi:hypothetical protein
MQVIKIVCCKTLVRVFFFFKYQAFIYYWTVIYLLYLFCCEVEQIYNFLSIFCIHSIFLTNWLRFYFAYTLLIKLCLKLHMWVKQQFVIFFIYKSIIIKYLLTFQNTLFHQIITNRTTDTNFPTLKRFNINLCMDSFNWVTTSKYINAQWS